MSIKKNQDRVFGIKVLLDFAAAHHIVGYPGDCARPHGHNYKLEIEATTPVLNPIGLAADFKTIKRMAKEVVDQLDHRNLNELPAFTAENPTAENIACYLFECLENQLRANPETENLTLKTVTVWENDRCAASYGLA